MPIGNQGGLIYNVDIVMCIDKTGSMAPILGTVKTNALDIYKKFETAMNNEGKRVEELRIKVIAFGDYDCDTRPMMISRFFTLPEENDEFEAFLNGVNAEGGGDAPENALEALAHAIKSDWTEDGNVRRHVIMLFTDTSALELGVRTNFENDDERMPMPADLAELGDWWDEMESRARRFVLFAPNGYPWDDLAVAWEDVTVVPSAAGTGCEDVDIDTAIEALVRSVGKATVQ